MRLMEWCSAILGVACATRLEAQTLQEFSPARKNEGHVTVFADGNVKDVVGQKDGTAAASGSLGMSFRGDTYIVSGLVNALSKSDTVTEQFGAQMLPPATGHAFNSALIDVRRPTLPLRRLSGGGCGPDATRLARGCQVGLHAYVFASATTWATAKDTAGKVTTAAEVPSWGSGLGGYFTFFDGFINDSGRVAMALDVSYATRHLRGDFGAGRSDSVRKQLLGTKRRDFGGMETAVNLRYNELNAALSYYYFGGKVPGFSGGQIVAAISVRARLNEGSYSRQPKPAGGEAKSESGK